MTRSYRYLPKVVLSVIVAAAALVCSAKPSKPQDSEPSLEQAKADYIRADKALNAAWEEFKKTPDKRRFESLRWDQRRWIGYRDYFSGEVLMRDHNIPAGKLKQRAEHWKSMTDITRQRISILRSIISARKKRLELTGMWTDGYGGHMDIVTLGDGKIAFSIEVVRGPTHHLGSLTGLADKNGSIIRFSDAETEPKKEKATWLTAIQRGDHIEVITANSHYYHGMRAYFDGDYYRIGDLKKIQRDRIVKNVRSRSGDKK